MDSKDVTLLKQFSELPAPCNRIGLRHSLEEVLLISVLALICGADDWIAVEEYANMQLGFISQFIELPHGPPSDDTFRRVFIAFDTVVFEQLFFEWRMRWPCHSP